MVRRIIVLLAICILLSGCLLEPTTTISEGADKENLALLNIKKANDRRGNSFNIVSIDNQRISIFSNKIRISPGSHSMDIICDFNGSADFQGNIERQTEHRTIQFIAEPGASYDVVLNLPNPSASYSHPCEYMQLKETTSSHT